MSDRIGILYHGAGNVYSVCRGIKAVGATPVIIEDGNDVAAFDKLILPGVGAFGIAMERLAKRGMIEPILRHAADGKPTLGICLGAQLLMDSSEEFGHHNGLGLISGHVVRIDQPGNIRVPHVGWARLRPAKSWESGLLGNQEIEGHAYFCHSFICEPEDRRNVTAEVKYSGLSLVAAVSHENILGVQFHPELSAQLGLSILKAFAET